MDYGVPEGNDDRSVIYGNYLQNGNAAPVEQEAVNFLKRSGITQVVVGHIPHGECPTVIRTDGETEASRSSRVHPPSPYKAASSEVHRLNESPSCRGAWTRKAVGSC